MSNPPKSPWGGGAGSGNGGGDDGDGNGGGPRNPWSVPPSGNRSGPRSNVSSIEELLKRARRGGGGGGFGGGAGVPGMPFGPRMWLLIGGLVLLVWIGFTSFHPISQQERGVVTTLGRYSGTLEPGYRFTLPAPFSSVTVIDVTNFRVENFPESGGENLMLTGDQNIVDLAYSVRWNIADAPDFVFQFKEPQKTVRATAETAMRAVVATTTLNEAIGAGRARIEARVQQVMQQILDEYGSGVRILNVSINKAAAPAAVDDAFKAVTAAQQQAQANKNNANAYAQQVIAQAQGEAAEFNKLYEQYKLAPDVTRRRLYFETMERVLSKVDKTIIEAPGVNAYLPLPQPLRRAEDPEPKAQGGNR